MRLKLVGALRSGELETITNLFKENSEASEGRLQLLHIAIQIASLDTINWLLQTFDLDVNGIDIDGNTPLHLAALYGREDVALALLSVPQINDTIENKQGKQPVELSKYPETAEAMQIARAQYVEKISGLLKKYLLEENTSELENLLSNPRASALLDINGQDPDTGSTVLHEFCRKRNKKMVEFILSHGGDPFKRDSKGGLPIDVTKDEGIRRLLRSAQKDQSIIQAPTSTRTAQMNDPPSMKGYLKKWTNITGGYKLRWFILENGVLSYYKKQDDTEKACRGSINMRQALLHLDSSEKLRFEVHVKGSSSKFHLKANHPVETNRWVWALSNAIKFAKDQDSNSALLVASRPPSITGSTLSTTKKSARKSTDSISIALTKVTRTPSRSTTGTAVSSNFFDKEERVDESEIEDIEDDESDISEEDKSNPLLSTLKDTVNLEICAMKDLLQILLKDIPSDTNNKIPDGLEALYSSVQSLEIAISDFSSHISLREQYFQRALEKANSKELLWSKNVHDLEIEHERIQDDLYRALQMKKEESKIIENKKIEGIQGPICTINDEILGELSDEDDDEFFDAIGEGLSSRNSLEEDQEQVDKSAQAGELTDSQVNKQKQISEDNSFAGYPDTPRTKLSTDEDNRPKISLWGVLKSMIGKDMTRMTLPVSFNECTNLLQRSAEDMEYTDILDNGARAADDPSLRLAHVAAFAASSYSSTINRIAKPFNPLLGETFEYCRPDCGYRMFSEQVSHHPPIGAMLAESAKWDFYGDSNVESRFYGRSFDFNPLGRWYVVLRPDKGAGIEEELYSFRKLTSSVVGIITGSPAVDNFGDMEIINHTLGHKALIKFKPRGWRSAHAYELKGSVKNPSGVAEWVVGGKWNDKIYARKLKANTASENVKSPGVEDDSPNYFEGKPILLWQIHDRPKAPFNLTPFAISLNALPSSLKDWLAPTDTRLRPDQRAMEEFRYDDAAVEKRRVEEKQRAARRYREQNNIIYTPKWFTKESHPVTGEVYYKPNLEYWKLRKEKGLSEAGDIF